MFGIPCHAPPSSCLIITWLHTYSIDALRSPPTTYLRLLVFTADDDRRFGECITVLVGDHLGNP